MLTFTGVIFYQSICTFTQVPCFYISITNEGLQIMSSFYSLQCTVPLINILYIGECFKNELNIKVHVQHMFHAA